MHETVTWNKNTFLGGLQHSGANKKTDMKSFKKLIRLKLSTMATLGTEESGGCGEI